MKSEESATLIFRRKLFAGVEDKIQYGDMGTEQDIRNDRVFHQVRFETFVPWIFVRTDVGVRPTIKSPLLDVREIIGYQIVAQRVPLLNGSPQGVCTRIPVKPDHITQSRSEDLVSGTVRIVTIDSRSPGVFSRVHVRARANRQIKLLA